MIYVNLAPLCEGTPRRKLYNGLMGNAHYNERGMTNFMCLHRDGAASAVDPTPNSAMSDIVPSLYHTNGFGANTITHLSMQPAPCSVCEVEAGRRRLRTRLTLSLPVGVQF